MGARECTSEGAHEPACCIGGLLGGGMVMYGLCGDIYAQHEMLLYVQSQRPTDRCMAGALAY
eukprot:scaffold118936_cov28-Tisochrysis_lutea.AAC.2